jgi:hypothetical protein
MSKALQGALLSALVFPGAGHIALKHYSRGLLLILAVLAGLSAIAVKVMQRALVVVDQILSGETAISLNAISSAVQQASAGADSRTIALLPYLILLCWITGIADAYRIGKRKDSESLR